MANRFQYLETKVETMNRSTRFFLVTVSVIAIFSSSGYPFLIGQQPQVEHKQSALDQPRPSVYPNKWETPQGALYDIRTHIYSPERKQPVRLAQFNGMTNAQRKGAYARLGIQLGPTDPEKYSTAMINRAAEKEKRHQARLANNRAKAEEERLRHASLLLSTRYNASNMERYIRGATVHIYAISSDGGGSLGSGVITNILGRKYVLTANHVIYGKQAARLTSVGDRTWGDVNRADGWHFGYDIAAMPLPQAMQHLPYVPLFNGKAQPRDNIYLSGFPGGNYYHITSGTVAGHLGTSMLHTAASEAGSSGGMLMNSRGYLCGIHTATFKPGSPYYPLKRATPSWVIIALIRGNAR